MNNSNNSQPFPISRDHSIFFSSEGQGGLHRARHYFRSDSSRGFFENMIFAILSFFVLRFAWILLLTLLSPPVLLLCLFAFLSTRGSSNVHSHSNGFQCHKNRRHHNGRRQACHPSGIPELSPNSHQRYQQFPSPVEAGTTNDVDIIDKITDTLGLTRMEHLNNTNSEKASSHVDGFKHGNRPVHINDTDDFLIVSLDISGFNIADTQITIEDSRIHIRGERTNKIGDTIVIEEYIDLDENRFIKECITANVSDGILEVKVGKKEESKPRSIPITNIVEEKEN
jgi:HSP20 family molecular chaperone IbpA